MSASDSGRGRPRQESGPETPARKSLPSLPPAACRCAEPAGHLDALARFSDAYAVLVVGKATRRHLFFNLPAAERAVDRANARGDDAALVLVRLVPVAGGAL